MRILDKIDEHLDEAVNKFTAMDAAGKILDMDVLKRGRLRDLLIKAGAIKSVNESVKVINQMAKIITDEME